MASHGWVRAERSRNGSEERLDAGAGFSIPFYEDCLFLRMRNDKTVCSPSLYIRGEPISPHQNFQIILKILAGVGTLVAPTDIAEGLADGRDALADELGADLARERTVS